MIPRLNSQSNTLGLRYRKQGMAELVRYRVFMQKNLLWWKLNESEEGAVINSGSAGAAGNGTNINNVAVGAEVGNFAPAYNWDSADNVLQLPAGNAVGDAVFNAQKLTMGWFIYPRASLFGGSGFGTLWSAQAFSNIRVIFNGSLSALRCDWVGTTQTGLTVTNVGVTPNAWQWLFMTFDATEDGDGIIRFYVYRNRTLTELNRTTETPILGTAGYLPGTITYNVGNRQNGVNYDRGWDAALRGHFTSITRAYTPPMMRYVGSLDQMWRDVYDDTYTDVY